jgi:CRP-like cAMP-binding protein
LKPRNRFHRELQNVPILASLSDDELAQVARIAVRMRRPAGELLIKEGEAGNEFLIVLEGEIEVRRGSGVVGTIGPGGYVGEIALLDPIARRTATVVTKTPVTVAYLGRSEFTRLLDELPTVAQDIQETWERRHAADS